MHNVGFRTKQNISRVLAFILALCMIPDLHLAYASSDICTCQFTISAVDAINLEVDKKGTAVDIHSDLVRLLVSGYSSDICSLHASDITGPTVELVDVSNETGGTLESVDSAINITLTEDTYTSDVVLKVKYQDQTSDELSLPMSVSYSEEQCLCEVSLVTNSTFNLEVAKELEGTPILVNETSMAGAFTVSYDRNNCTVHTDDTAVPTYIFSAVDDSWTPGDILTGSSVVDTVTPPCEATIAMTVTYNGKTASDTFDLTVSVVETACTCELDLDASDSVVEATITDVTEVTGDLTNYYSLDYSLDGCLEHNTEDFITGDLVPNDDADTEPTVEYTILSESGGTASITGDTINITGIITVYEAEIQVKATFNGIESTDTFKVEITRELSNPAPLLTIQMPDSGEPEADAQMRVVIGYSYVETVSSWRDEESNTITGELEERVYTYSDLLAGSVIEFQSIGYDFPEDTSGGWGSSTEYTDKKYTYNVYYTYEGTEGLISSENAELPDGGTTFTLDEYPSCDCHVVINSTTDYTDNIGTEISAEIDLSNQVDIEVELCPFHDALSEDIVTEYVIESELGGLGIISSNTVGIEMEDLTYTATIKVTATYKETTAEDTFEISLERESSAPSIIVNSYDGSTGKLNITVKPNGNKKATVYLSDTLVAEITFEKKGGFMGMGGKLQNYTMDIDVVDTVIPKIVENVTAERLSTDPTKIVLTWDDGGDNNNYVTLKAENDGQSSTTQANIKSSSTLETVVIRNTDDSTDQGTTLQTQSSSNRIVLDIADVPYNNSISIITYDDALNGPVEKTYSIPHEVIYNPTIVNDTATDEELQIIRILAKENDIHDEAFITPVISTVEILNGAGGVVEVLDASQYTDLPEGTTGLIIIYNAPKLSTDSSENIRLKYTYTQVRSDIPAAFGYIDLTITPVNQPPVAVNDGTDVTDKYNALSGRSLTIPWDDLLENDYDRETLDKTQLTIHDVRNVTSGTIDSIDSLREIRITPNKTFYGTLTFQYRLYDGKLTSLDWATVTVNIVKAPNPPIASPVETYMQITESAKAIGLNVDNTGGTDYEAKIVGNILVNGSVKTAAHGLSAVVAYQEDESGNSLPYIRLTKTANSTLKAGDIISFSYNVFNEYSTSAGSTSTIKVTISEGDDPLDMEGYLYVHRKPIAAFAPIITLDSTKTYVAAARIDSSHETSYDLDHQLSHDNSLAVKSNGGTRPDYSWNGLRAWEWGLKTVSGEWKTKVFDVQGVPAASDKEEDVGKETTYATADAARIAGLAWIQTQLNSLIAAELAGESKESIIVSLRVRDIDADNTIGVWSDQRTVMLTSMKMKPVALFTISGSTFEISSTTTIAEFDKIFNITDLSYDPNGDPLTEWGWELTDGTGRVLLAKTPGDTYRNTTELDQVIAEDLVDLYADPNTDPATSEYTLSLIVKDNTGMESDKYSVTFNVFRGNNAPKFDDSTSNLNTLVGSTVYEIDDGADGIVGDDWGTETNSNGHPGKIDFSKMFTITDDQPLEDLVLSWLLEGNSVATRREWSEDHWVHFQYSKSGLKYKPFESPFINTVTAQGFLPGAYKISVSAKDNPTGEAYADGASKTSYWSTGGYEPIAPPWHLYVVPKLDIFAEVQYNGWVLAGDFNGDTWVDKSYRISDGATLAEAGLELEDIVPTIGDTLTIAVTTNKYVTELYGYEDYNGNKTYNAGEVKFNMLRKAVNTDGTITWEGTYTIEDIDDAPEGEEFTTLRLMLYGSTIWGSETGDVTRTKQIPLPTMVLPVKLYDFRVTSLTDPTISEGFTKYINKLIKLGDTLNNGKATDGALVGRLAVDENSKAELDTTIPNMRKGYSFYFSVNSKGLTKDSDEVRIFPKLYAMTTDASGNITIGKELIGCVPNIFGKYEEYTTSLISEEINGTYGLYYEGSKINSLNSHAEIRIPVALRTVDGSEQTWYGRYGIPSDARFFYADEYDDVGVSTKIEWKGQVLVAFETVAYKDGRARYNYVERNQWSKERSLIPDGLKTQYISKETNWIGSKQYLGAIMVYDANKSLRDDYTSNPVWNE